MCSSHPVGWAVWKTNLKKRCWREYGEAGTISTAGGRYNGIALGKPICRLFKKLEMCLACNPEILSLGVSPTTMRNHPKEMYTYRCSQRCCVQQLRCGVITNAQQMCTQPKRHPSTQWAVPQPEKGQKTFWDALKCRWAPRSPSQKDRHRVYSWGSWRNQTADKSQNAGSRDTGRGRRVLNRDIDGWIVYWRHLRWYILYCEHPKLRGCWGEIRMRREEGDIIFKEINLTAAFSAEKK